MSTREVIGSMMQEQVEALLDDFPEREALVMRERFGLVDGQPKTLKALGARLQVTPERVRQIEARAIRRVRLRLQERSDGA